MNSLTVNLVRDASGLIDVEASLAVAKEAVQAFGKSEEAAYAAVSEAILTVFRAFPDRRSIKMSEVVLRALTHLPTDMLRDYDLAKEQIENHLRTNKETYAVARGPGGVHYLPRLTKEERAKLQVSLDRETERKATKVNKGSTNTNQVVEMISENPENEVESKVA